MFYHSQQLTRELPLRFIQTEPLLLPRIYALPASTSCNSGFYAFGNYVIFNFVSNVVSPNLISIREVRILLLLLMVLIGVLGCAIMGEKFS